jgi:DNA-binding NtrC family response regulator
MVGLKVLILDDENRICEELSEFLIRKKYSVRYANKPSIAFQMLQSYPVDILFLDYTLPEMDGIHVLRKMKEKYPDIKVIMISGAENRQIKKEAKEGGAIDFISKPFLHNEVQNALQGINNDDEK